MIGKEIRVLVGLLLISLFLGGVVAIWGGVGRRGPPTIDPIWHVVEDFRTRIMNRELVLDVGGQEELTFMRYEVELVRLQSDDPKMEKYQLQIRSGYEPVPGQLFSPGSWDVGLIAYRAENETKRAHIVYSRRNEP